MVVVQFDAGEVVEVAAAEVVAEDIASMGAEQLQDLLGRYTEDDFDGCRETIQAYESAGVVEPSRARRPPPGPARRPAQREALPVTTCDECPSPAAFTITAAYSRDPGAIHPLFATYPAPMARTCADHLAARMERDQQHPGSTPAYLVRPLR